MSKKTIIVTEKQFKNLKDTFRLGMEGGYCHVIDENAEFEVDADQVDLSSFKPKESLTQSLWNGDELNPRVRLRLLDIADDFIDFLGIEGVEPVDIRLTGSICNYNWSDQSDIDVHIVYRFKEIDDDIELVENYVDTKKNEWNDMHDSLTIYGFNVEFYVEDESQVDISAGEYSLEKGEWLKTPSKEDVILKGKDEIKYMSSKIMTILDDYSDLFYYVQDDSHKLEELGNDLEDFRVFLKNMRSQQLDKDGEMAIGNIVYKVLRRTGYLDTLYDLQNKVYDKLNSIE